MQSSVNRIHITALETIETDWLVVEAPSKDDLSDTVSALLS